MNENEWQAENMIVMGYLLSRRVYNDYQREWRIKNKDRCENYIAIRKPTEQRKQEIKEYQKQYYLNKRKKERKVNV